MAEWMRAKRLHTSWCGAVRSILPPSPVTPFAPLVLIMTKSRCPLVENTSCTFEVGAGATGLGVRALAQPCCCPFNRPPPPMAPLLPLRHTCLASVAAPNPSLPSPPPLSMRTCLASVVTPAVQMPLSPGWGACPCSASLSGTPFSCGGRGACEAGAKGMPYCATPIHTCHTREATRAVSNSPPFFNVIGHCRSCNADSKDAIIYLMIVS